MLTFPSSGHLDNLSKTYFQDIFTWSSHLSDSAEVKDVTNLLADESFESGDKFSKRTDATKVRPATRRLGPEVGMNEENGEVI